MRVLHAVTSFLRISENWLYPQVMQVPGVRSAVLCGERENASLFPLRDSPMFLDPPAKNEMLGIPRLLNSLSFRAGHPSLIVTRRVARWRPDVVHAHFGSRGWDMLALARRWLVPLITSFYGVDAWRDAELPLMRERFRELFSKGALFLAEGPAMAERLRAVGAPAARIRVVRLGIDLDRITFRERNFTPPLRVVMMARFVEKKGLPDGLAACGEAVRRGADLQVTIIGDGTDAPGCAIREDLHALAATPAMAGRVTFAGFLKPAEAQAVLESAHIFLCPSKHSQCGDAEGGSPLALTEAMASGLFCIGTRHCDLPEVIRDRETGMLCDSSDIDGLANALVFAARNPTALPALCRAGRQHVEARFSIPQMLEELSRIYAEAVGSQS